MLKFLKIERKTPSVDFINVLRTRFSYESLFGSFFLVTFWQKKYFCTKARAYNVDEIDTFWNQIQTDI